MLQEEEMNFRKARKPCWVSLLMVIVLMAFPQLGQTSGSRPRLYHLAIVPIDLDCFAKSGDWYLKRFPRMLRDAADNAVFEEFRQFGDVRQVHLWWATEPNRESISAFHEKLVAEGTEFAKQFCTDRDPRINILVTFELDAPCEQLNTSRIDVRIPIFYVTKEQDDFTVWHRTAFASDLDPRDSQRMMMVLEEVLAKVLQAYRENPSAN